MTSEPRSPPPLRMGGPRQSQATSVLVQVKRNPAAYGAPQQDGDAVERWLKDRVLLSAINELATHGMVRWWPPPTRGTSARLKLGVPDSDRPHRRYLRALGPERC